MTAQPKRSRTCEMDLAEAEAFREHEALATSEGMPSGQLDEDPPPPVVKVDSCWRVDFPPKD